MRRRLFRVAAAVAVAGSAVVAWPSGAGADLPDRSGWWWQANNDAVAGLGAATPPPPDAPQGGLYVAGTKAQPVAIGAVHLQSEMQGGTATLTLHAADGGFTAAPGLLACPTHSYWSSVEAGPWSQAPKVECDGAGGGVAGTASTDGSSMTWKLTSAFETAPGEWNVVVVPPDAPVRAAIDAPGDDAIVVSGGAPASPGFDDSAAAPMSSDEPLDAGAASPVFDAPAVSPSSAFALPALDSPATAGASTAGSSPAPAPSGSVSPGSAAAAIPASVSVPGPARGRRLMAFVLLLAMAAALWWLGGAPARAPRHLGALAVAGGVDPGPAALLARGIGRFRRPRDGRAPRL